MKDYKIEVWFRYVVSGEQEKDFEVFNIKAWNVEEASQKALAEFETGASNCIPFAIKNLDV